MYSLYLFIFLLSCSLTWILRRYALAVNMLDIPNHRSSHVIPTPRGGGVAFVICFLLLVAYIAYLGFTPVSLVMTLFVGGGVIALVGFFDDRGAISAKWRLLGHFVICSFVIYKLEAVPAITIFNWTLTSGVILNGLILFYLVWLLNLYNFMDGIDGIAAVEAISVCLGGAILYYLNGHLSALIFPLSLAVAVAGFLYWNFPPAKIFMGDAGSGFLGLVIGILSIQATLIDVNFFWSWLILLGVFIVDATLTLLRRAIRKKNLLDAHCSHAYQFAARYYNSHLSVTMGVLLINMVWLFPFALVVGLGYIDGSFGLMLAYLPLVFLALKYKAGEA